MYVGTHYNGYYNSLYGSKGSSYSNAGSKVNNSLLSQMGNSGLFNNSAVSKGSMQYMQDIKTGSADLKGAMKDLTSGAAFRNKTAVSSDTDALSVKVENGKQNYSRPKATVKIDQVASAQQNVGEALNSRALAGEAGTKQFEIEIDGKATQISIDVKSTDTNKDVQEKMAQAINGKNLGITASVSSSKDSSSLRLKSASTGADPKNSFSIRDVSGGLVAKTGADRVQQEAQDAIYSVNGGEKKTSSSNQVDLGNGVTGTLKKASEKEVEVTTGIDKENAKSKVQDMVNGYNKIYSATVNNPDDAKANKLFSQFVGISKTYKSSLDKVGIGFDKNGKMTIDKKKMDKAAEDGSLEKFFAEGSRSNYGFANQLNKVAGDVERNPLSFVDKNAISSGNLVQGGFTYGSAMQMRNMNFLAGMSFDFKL